MEDVERAEDWEEDLSGNEEEDLSGNDDEIADDDRTHNKLLASIGALDDKKKARQLLQRTEPAAVSEFHLPTSEGQVKVHELMVALKKTSTHSDLKKQLNRVQKRQKTLTTPLSKPEQERIERSVAYDKTTSEVSKWNSVVLTNRQALQLQFPLEKPSIHIDNTTEFVRKFQPHTSLEKEVAALLRGSQNVLTGGSELTEAERRALKAMSIEEARERRAELQKYRVLLSYKEAKAKRQKKIKSKRFHRVLRKERQKGEQKALNELKETDPEAYTERLEQTERVRMQERMSLKHRGGSKFMKQQMIYGKYDDKSRQSVQEMLQKSRELSQKRTNPDASGDSSEDDDLEVVMADTTDVFPSSTTIGQNPWMDAKVKVRKPAADRSQEPVVRQEVVSEDTSQPDVAQTDVTEETGKEDKENIDSSADEDDKPNEDIEEIFSAVAKKQGKEQTQEKPVTKDSRRKKKRKARKERDSANKMSKQTIVHDLSDFVQPDNDEDFIRMSLTRRKAQEDFEDNLTDDESEATPREAPKETEKANLAADNKTKHVSVDVDPKKFFTVEKTLTRSKAPDLVTKDNEEGFVTDEDQRMTIAQAFASDDVIEEFRQEKKSTEERDKPKDIDLSLPGWGSWAGAGIVPSKRKNKRFIIKAPTAPPRKDAGLHNVIISETKDNSVAKHQVSHLPFPFSSVHQFESSVRQPIGKTWNPETAYHQLIKPKVVTRLGTVISPISKEATFSKEKQKSGNFGGKRKQDDMMPVGKKEAGGKFAKRQRGGKLKK